MCAQHNNDQDKKKIQSKEKTYNRDYIEYPRYKQCNKEALLCIGLGVADLIWWFAWGYGLGAKDPAEYTYVMGFPIWFFMSSIVGAVLFTILAVIMVNKFFKDFPLDDLTEEEVREDLGEFEQRGEDK